MPAKQSRYSRPPASVMTAPCARSTTTGATDFKKLVITYSLYCCMVSGMGLVLFAGGRQCRPWLGMAAFFVRPRHWLELPAVLLDPAFDDDLLVGIELDGIVALRVQRAEKAFLPAAERKIRHWGGDTDVDADVSRRCLVAEFARGSAAGGKQRGLVAIGAAGEDSDGFIHVLGRDQAQHRPENLGARQLAIRRHAVQD